ncbi:MAG: SpoIID/LytB domain-containing protein [Flavobacteriales bacterium]
MLIDLFHRRVLCLLLVLLFTPFLSRALPDIMRIGLFYGEKVPELEFSVNEGRYRVYAAGKPFGVFTAGDGLKCEHSEAGKMRIQGSSGKSLLCEKVRIERSSPEGNFRLKKTHPYPADRLYPGELTVQAKQERIQVINRVAMEKYLSGVVLAEAGKDHHPEFYKVQAVICRTYALHNLRKFKEQGIHLCDKVACQVYEGMNRVEPRIDSAVKATEGIILVDEEIRLITAAYHSNSGGRTAASEDAWSKALPYLRPVDDPFSKGGKHYRWKKVLPKKEWLNYLEREFAYPVEKPWYKERATSFCPKERRRDLLPFRDSVSLQKIRRDLNLNSTFFHISERNDSVVFRGKGFGHGVGLSQEGAMRMAELGIPYDEIIHYYYQGVHLVKIKALDFFRNGEG